MAHTPDSDAAALDALASPVRQEVLSAFGHGPATVRELAAQLGRSRQALHYHVGRLERAGLIRGEGWRGTGPAREQVYTVARPRIAIAATTAARDLSTANRAVAAMLRLTQREITAALAAPDLERRGASREFMALRGKARLTATELRRLNKLLDQVESLLRNARGRSGPRHYAVTLVLTPAGKSRKKEAS